MVDVRLLTQLKAAAPGQKFSAGVELAPRDGWHVYWKNPGDSGMATSVAWILPKGWSASGPSWPAPRRITAGPLTSFGYESAHILLFDLSVPGDAQIGSRARVAAHVEWLECREICIPGSKDLKTDVAIAAVSASGADSAALVPAILEIPHPNAAAAVRASAEGETVHLVLRGEYPGAEFFPSEPGAFESGRAAVVLSPARTELILADGLGGTPQRVSGVLERPNLPPVSIDLPVSSGGLLLRYLLLAFAGGLILNLMPCVLPVLSLKVLGLLSRAGRDAKRHGAAYSAGVVVMFEILAALILAGRAAGAGLGWGFQLQSPVVVGTLIILFVAIGLNLLGVYEVAAVAPAWFARAADSDGIGGSFASGMFSVVVASPCTAPFMGAALGWALIQPAGRMIAAFAALGAGTAAPFAILSAWPALIKKLPKPGAWMDALKKILSVPMFATAIWLAWIFWRLTFAAAAPVDAMWKKYSPAAVEAARARGDAVFVDFTAAWCLTCAVNERVVLSRDDVRSALSSPHVAAFRADWTNRDPVIAAELKSRGRSGVPLYVAYASGGPPVVLPEVLTPAIVLQSLGISNKP